MVYCRPQNFLSPLLNTLSQISPGICSQWLSNYQATFCTENFTIINNFEITKPDLSFLWTSTFLGTFSIFSFLWHCNINFLSKNNSFNDSGNHFPDNEKCWFIRIPFTIQWILIYVNPLTKTLSLTFKLSAIWLVVNVQYSLIVLSVLYSLTRQEKQQYSNSVAGRNRNLLIKNKLIIID